MISYTNDNSLVLQNLGLETRDRNEMVDTRDASLFLGVSEYLMALWRRRGTYNLPFICTGNKRTPRPMYRMGDLIDLKDSGVIRETKVKIPYASRKIKIPLTQKGNVI